MAASLVAIIIGCDNEGSYFCTPCDRSCDALTFAKSGNCSECGMRLVPSDGARRQDSLKVNEIDVREGSGSFLIEGGVGREEKTIRVYYHKPKNFSSNSPVLLVIPGAGRNGDSYRNAWVEASEKYSALILSPTYSAKNYGFGDYHLGGLIENVQIRGVPIAKADPTIRVWRLDDSDLTFEVNPEPAKWIFQDFDRIFESVIEALGSAQTTYDIFGHSAGGQILHRFALFHPDSKADRILASNSGFYTTPDSLLGLPFGIKATGLDASDLKKSFQKKLALFIGELDNENETRGTRLHTPIADQQGLHRLARGKYFYQEAQKLADQMGVEFNWELVVVPGVGHDHEKMGQAAASFLFGKTD